MPVSMSSATLPVLGQILDALEGVIGKAEAHAAARKIAPDSLLFARLFPDMFHFRKQVQVSCDFAMKLCARLSGIEPVKLEQTEKSFAELKALVARAGAYVKAADAATIDARADTVIRFPMGERTTEMTGQDYAFRFALPNFFFHATTAYAILRENGVELSKPDYIGAMID